MTGDVTLPDPLTIKRNYMSLEGLIVTARISTSCRNVGAWRQASVLATGTVLLGVPAPTLELSRLLHWNKQQSSCLAAYCFLWETVYDLCMLLRIYTVLPI